MKKIYWRLRRRLALFLWDVGAGYELAFTRDDQATARRLREERNRLEHAFDEVI